MLESLATFLLPAKMKMSGSRKRTKLQFSEKMRQFHLYLSKVRFRKMPQWCWGKKMKRNQNPLILQFHTGDQCFILNEDLLPSEMQMRLCCFSLLYPEAHTLPVCTSQVSGAGDIIISREPEGVSTSSDGACRPSPD